MARRTTRRECLAYLGSRFRILLFMSSRYSDVEVGAVLLDATVPVIGRMNVSACDAYWTSCKDNPSYDVVWWRLELAAASSEFPFEEPPIVEPI